MSVMGWFSKLKSCKEYEIIEKITHDSFYLKVSHKGDRLFESIIDRCHCANERLIKKTLVFKMRESLKNQGHEL